MSEAGLSFEEFMSRSGVKPLGEKGARPASKPKTPGAPPRVAAPSGARPGAVTAAPAEPALAPAQRAAEPVQSARPAPGPASAPSGGRGARPEDVRVELWAELERLRGELQARSKQLHDARAEASAATVELDDLKDLLRRQSTELRQVIADRQALKDTLAGVQADRDELDQHRRSLQQSLERARAEVVTPRRGLRATLEARGLVGDSEVDLLMRSIGELRESAGFIGALDAEDPESLEVWLEDRVALVCSGCAAAPGRAVLNVPARRCDVCGGSDIRRAVKRFQDVVMLCGLSRVVIVGGSPQYHRQIRALLTEPRITLNLVPGDRRRSLKQVSADEAGADLVVVWGATMLDHSLSQLYGRGEGRVVRVPHRGIARMFERAADELSRSAG